MILLQEKKPQNSAFQNRTDSGNKNPGISLDKADLTRGFFEKKPLNIFLTWVGTVRTEVLKGWFTGGWSQHYLSHVL